MMFWVSSVRWLLWGACTTFLLHHLFTIFVYWILMIWYTGIMRNHIQTLKINFSITISIKLVEYLCTQVGITWMLLCVLLALFSFLFFFWGLKRVGMLVWCVYFNCVTKCVQVFIYFLVHPLLIVSWFLSLESGYQCLVLSPYPGF